MPGTPRGLIRSRLLESRKVAKIGGKETYHVSSRVGPTDRMGGYSHGGGPQEASSPEAAFKQHLEAQGYPKTGKLHPTHVSAVTKTASHPLHSALRPGQTGDEFAKAAQGAAGHWVTMRGAHVFIAD